LIFFTISFLKLKLRTDFIRKKKFTHIYKNVKHKNAGNVQGEFEHILDDIKKNIILIFRDGEPAYPKGTPRG